MLLMRRVMLVIGSSSGLPGQWIVLGSFESIAATQAAVSAALMPLQQNPPSSWRVSRLVTTLEGPVTSRKVLQRIPMAFQAGAQVISFLRWYPKSAQGLLPHGLGLGAQLLSWQCFPLCPG